MIELLAKIIGRLIAVLIDKNVISNDEGVYILEPIGDFLEKYK